ncbi:HK97 family phage prohead protease [uncultured Bacteroides sp.]|uniref:HK97 family phage prohead protease n=1 Tax=uncultured Bacteroides sp. TaxID=162156 RepID=UPI00259AADFE|nr:HK97 family phage prohead protease [uncultured Bacteroides sp.]
MEDRTEIRNTTFQVTANEEDEKRTVEGYALLFGVNSDNLGFEEVIERGALDGVLGKSDVFALLNHDRSKGILARAKNGSGSLSLEVDTKGLKYRFEAPKTALGNELLENLRRGEIDQSSFAFTVADGGEKWERQKNGVWKRTISKFERIYDVSPVYNAAYSKTSVYMRGKEEAEKELEQREKQNLEEYYKEITNSLNI